MQADIAMKLSEAITHPVGQSRVDPRKDRAPMVQKPDTTTCDVMNTWSRSRYGGRYGATQRHVCRHRHERLCTLCRE